MIESSALEVLTALRPRWRDSWSTLQRQARALLVCDPSEDVELRDGCTAAAVRADVVSDMDAAREMLQEDRYEVVVLARDGVTALIHELREAEDTRPIFVVAEAGRPENLRHLRRALALGASDYVLRPSPFLRAFGVKVRASMERRLLERLTLLMTGDLKSVLASLDPLSRRQMTVEFDHSLKNIRRMLWRRGCRILVVEPDSATRKILAQAATGKDVMVMTGDSTAVLETLQVTPVQVLVAAVQLLKEGDPGDLVREILEYNRQIEIVLVAGEDQVDLAMAGIADGAFDCIARPVADPELARCCIARARRSQEQATLRDHLLGELRRLTEAYAEPGMQLPSELLPMEEPAPSERRRQPRATINLPVSLWPAETPEQVIEVRTTDLSPGGIGVQSILVMPVGTPLGLSLELPSRDGEVQRLVMEGRVTWVSVGTVGEGSGPGFGVRFINSEASATSTLREFLEGVESSGEPPP